MGIKWGKPSPALIVAVVALVAALAGTAIGGVVVSKLSGKEKKQVTKIAKKQAKKLDKKIELTPGPKGNPGATDVTRRISALTTVAADGSAPATVNCKRGERAVGGGGIAWTGTTADFNLTSSAPIISPPSEFEDEGVPVAWQARYSNLDTNDSNDGDIEFRAYVVCAAP